MEVDRQLRSLPYTREEGCRQSLVSRGAQTEALAPGKMRHTPAAELGLCHTLPSTFQC